VRPGRRTRKRRAQASKQALLRSHKIIDSLLQEEWDRNVRRVLISKRTMVELKLLEKGHPLLWGPPARPKHKSKDYEDYGD
jgi:hypothetical protein